MYKKQDKDFLYDPGVINSINVNTKKTKKLNCTWIQNIFHLEHPEISKEVKSTMNLITGSLNKLGKPIKSYSPELLPIEISPIFKGDSSIQIKTSNKEDNQRIINEKIWENDLKINKKTEESKKILEKSSMISKRTKQKFEELEEKVFRLNVMTI